MPSQIQGQQKHTGLIMLPLLLTQEEKVPLLAISLFKMWLFLDFLIGLELMEINKLLMSKELICGGIKELYIASGE